MIKSTKQISRRIFGKAILTSSITVALSKSIFAQSIIEDSELGEGVVRNISSFQARNWTTYFDDRGYRGTRGLRIDAWSERRHETRGESPVSLVAPVTHHDRDRRLCSPKKEMAVSPRNQNAAVGGDHRADARSGSRQGARGGISRG